MKVRVTDRGPDGVARRWATSDSFNIDASKRQMTPEGFMVVPGKISRTGIQEYGARELGLEGTDRTIRLYRPPEEVFKDSTLASFENVPITSGHPDGDGVNANNFRSVTSGCAYDCQRAADGKTTDATLKFMAADAIDRVIEGQDQLSCGYSFRLDMAAGVTPDGEAYDGVMRDIEGNHVAHVWNARGGPGLRVADDNTHRQERDMRTIVIDGISIKVDDDTQASLIERAVKTANDACEAAVEAKDEAEAKIAAADAARVAAVESEAVAKEALKTATDAAAAVQVAHDAKIAELKAKILTDDQIGTLVGELASVTGSAVKILGDSVDLAGKNADAIRVLALEAIVAAKDESPAKGAVVAILGGAKPSEAKPETAKLAFDGAVGVLSSTGHSRGFSRDAADSAVARAFAPVGASDPSRRAADAKDWTGEEIYAYRKTHGGKNPPGFEAN